MLEKSRGVGDTREGGVCTHPSGVVLHGCGWPHLLRYAPCALLGVREYACGGLGRKPRIYDQLQPSRQLSLMQVIKLTPTELRP